METVSVEETFRGKFLNVFRNVFRYKDGTEVIREIVSKDDAVGILLSHRFAVANAKNGYYKHRHERCYREANRLGKPPGTHPNRHPRHQAGFRI